MTLNRSFARALRGLLLCAATAAAAGTAVAVDLADEPLFSTISVPGNLALALSVEFPTALSPAYPSTTAYAASSTYIGYFDPEKCYVYSYNSTTPSSSYFYPYASASSHACTTTSSKPQWSGNFLNWASMGALDTFRSVMTGGNRVVDTASTTVLEKAYNFNSGAIQTRNTPDKTISTAATIGGATPFTWTSATTKVWHQGAAMLITGTYTVAGGTNGTTTCYKGTTCVNVGSPASPYNPLTPDDSTSYYYNNQSSVAGTADKAKVYKLYIRVKVCDPSVGVESNCTAYGSNYKPEGLLQAYSSKLRYSAFGYLNIADYNSTNAKIDGGVMRARMKYIGPSQPVPGSASLSNSASEWSSTDGTLVTNPDASDATATVTEFGLSSTDVANSGVINYLNKFGSIYNDYKTYDPVSELYNAVLRYYKNAGNQSTYTAAMTSATRADGFPVITKWDDPVVYSCQKNFVLGIGDTNTGNDSNLEGSTIKSSNEVSATPSSVSSENVATSTAMVGTLEGKSGLATTHPNGSTNSYFIAGLAYDAHTVDLRDDLDGDQLVNTYWLDVWEYQTYASKNMYWLAAKYGGFEVPTGFDPYSSSNSSSTLADSTWYTSTDTVGSDKRPDNYFAANQADKMKSGLTSAFAKIAKEASATTTTAFGPLTRRTSSSGEANYSSSYDPKTWTGKLVASTLVTGSNGSATLTDVWDAAAILKSTSPANRKIVTCCTSVGAALPFQASSLSAATLHSRTYYASFSEVPGVESASQSAANFVAYLRGDTAQEVANGGVYRTRSGILGDIVDSKPSVVGAPSFPYSDQYNPGYSGFKSSYAARDTIVYVGANDGMMHAFDGSLTSSTGGSERFAYIPSFTYGEAAESSERYFATEGLAALGNPGYEHRYYVNATPKAFDALVGDDWRTLLIGGLGKGGKGYYAIDVTSPADWTSESAVAGKMLWEFTDDRLGYSYGDAHVVKTAKYGWTVVVPSGFNNSDGKGYIFLLDPSTGALRQAIATPSGSTSSPINLGHVRAFINDYEDYTADAVYGADLQGNLWRFDLTAETGYGEPTKLAELTNSSGDALPATTAPLLGVDPTSGKRYVMVGTGQMLSDSDINSTALQAFYAIADGTGDVGGFYTEKTLPDGYGFPLTRDDLTDVDTFKTELGDSASPMGWVYDFSAGSSGIAERMTVDGDVAIGMVAFSVSLPNGDACSPAGSSRTFAVRFATGKSALVDSEGTLIEYLSDSDTTNELLFTKNSDGSTSLTRGAASSGTGTVSNTSVDTGLSGFRFLSWREISTVD